MTMKMIEGAREPSLTKAQIADLKMKYGDELVRIVEGDGTYVFRSPTRPEYARYTSSLVKKRDDLITPSENLCFDCLVYPVSAADEPDAGRLRGVFAKKPGLSMTIAGKLSDLAGGGDDADVGKL